MYYGSVTVTRIIWPLKTVLKLTYTLHNESNSSLITVVVLPQKVLDEKYALAKDKKILSPERVKKLQFIFRSALDT